MHKIKDEITKALTEGKIVPYEQSLLDRLRKYTAYGLPCSIILLSSPCCNNECYAMSVLLSRGLDTFTLVHGNVNKFLKDDRYPNHSWIEKDGFVYDTTDGFKWDKELYYRLFEPEVIECYDEVSVEEDPYYQAVLANTKTEPSSKKALALQLQYLELLEQENHTVNHHRLLEEIEICRRDHQIMFSYSDRLLKEYQKRMNESKIK